MDHRSRLAHKIRNNRKIMSVQSYVGAMTGRTRHATSSNRQQTLGAASNSSDDLDLGAYLDHVKDIETNVDRSASEVQAMNARGVTPKHWKRANLLENSFIDGIAGIRKLHVLFYSVL